MRAPTVISYFRTGFEQSIAKHLCLFCYRQRARISTHRRQIRVWRCCRKRVNDEGCESIPRRVTSSTSRVQSCGFILRRLCTRQRVQTNDSRRRRFVFVLTRCRGVSQPRQRQNCFEYVFEPIKFEKVYCECEERRFEKLHVHGSVRVPTRFERFKRKATTIAIHTVFILSFITFRSL